MAKSLGQDSALASLSLKPGIAASPVDHDLERRDWREFTKAGPNGCLEWTRSVITGGYGSIFARTGSVRRQWRAHRYVYTVEVGPIPDGMFVCHSCDNRACVNPAHLWLGTCKDNLRDAKAKGRSVHGERAFKSKLTASQVLEILHSPAGPTELAKRFGVERQVIRHIRTGRSWNHVTGLPEIRRAQAGAVS